jgi:RNA polymerase sigma-70 factor (ECF subfamily)
MSDAALSELIKRAQQGDAAAFDRLVDAFAHRVGGFLYRMTGCREDLDDLVQEVFLRVVRMIGAYEHDGRFEAWIFRIAANLIRDRLRRAPKVVDADSMGGLEQGSPCCDENGLDRFEGRSEPADARLVRGEAVDALNDALARLPEAEREVVLLRHFSQMSFREIAVLMETPIGTALARAHRGLARLRELMISHDAERHRSPALATEKGYS